MFQVTPSRLQSPLSDFTHAYSSSWELSRPALPAKHADVPCSFSFLCTTKSLARDTDAQGTAGQKATDLQGWALPLVFPVPLTASRSTLTAALKEVGKVAGPLTLPDIQRTERSHRHNNRFLTFYTDPSRPEPQFSRKKTKEKKQKGFKNEARAL